VSAEIGLPWRFISASAGTVTRVKGFAAGEVPPEGKLVRLMLVSSAAPFAQDAARTASVYAGSPIPFSAHLFFTSAPSRIIPIVTPTSPAASHSASAPKQCGVPEPGVPGDRCSSLGWLIGVPGLARIWSPGLGKQLEVQRRESGAPALLEPGCPTGTFARPDPCPRELKRSFPFR